MSRRGDEQVQVQEWVYGRLSVSQPLADALGCTLAELPDHVWPDPAPPSAQGPVVVYSTDDGTDTIALGGLPRLMVTVPLLVKVVAASRDSEVVAPAARALYAELHGRRNEPVAEGGMIGTVTRTGTVQYPEQAAGVEYAHLGHQLQVQVE